MKREKQLQEIYRQLEGIGTQVKLENGIGVYAVNVYLENLIRDILNCILGCQFENGNYRRMNQKGYDLIENKQRLLVQVSSQNTAEKIQHSLDRLEFTGAEKWRFYFFLIGETRDNLRKKTYRIPETIEFCPEKDIWDMAWLVREIQNLDSDRVAKVYEILCESSSGDILTPKDIWKGVYRDYQMSMKEDVFALGDEAGWQKDREGDVHFNILERLLPDGYVSLSGIEGNGIDEKGERISLRSLVNQDSYESMTIIGEGGIGKTTFLRDIMNRTYKPGIYNPEKKIPIYIELSRTPSEIGTWYSKKRKKSNFLIRYIAGIVYDLEWSESSKEACACHEKIEQELQRRDVEGKEKYVLLLDGLNEVSMRRADEDGRTIADYLYMEIAEMQKYSNLTMILTSRRTRQAYAEANTRVIELVGVQDEDVKWYLEKTRFSEVQINRILMDRELMVCLRVPLFLCMFGNRKVEGVKTPCSRGEILYNFFHRDSPYYNEHRTAERIQREQYLTGTQITFIVDFLLPYIGWTMEYIEYYSLEESYLKCLIEEFLQDGERILWTERVETFDFYRKKHIKINAVREELSQIPYEKILECITEGLGVMYMNREREGGFGHQHFRDYFAAVYEIQILRVCYALSGIYEKTHNIQILEQCKELLSEINENIWSETKCSFVGEIAGEPRNRAFYKDGRWTKGEIILEEQKFLSQALRTFRTTGILPVEGLYNLIETMKLTRKDLSGTNFSELDLRGCRFNGAVCSHIMSEQFLAADFHGALVSEETFQASGHNGIVLQVQLSFDGENLFTLGEDGFLILWDSRTGKRLYSVQTEDFSGKIWGEPLKIEIMKEFGAILNGKEHLVKCNVYSGIVSRFKRPENCGQITDFSYNPKTGKIAAIYDRNCVILYDGETEDWEAVYRGDVLRSWSICNQEVLLLVQGKESEFILKKGNGNYPEIGRFCTKGQIVADYCGRTNMFVAACMEGIFIMDLDSDWWNIYSLNVAGHICSLKCHHAVKARVTIVSEKCCMEFDYEEQELWTVFQDEKIAFPDMVQCAGEKVFFMDEFEHTYMANASTGEVKRLELSDTTMVQKLFVDKLRKCIIVVDSKQNVAVYDVLCNQMLMSVQYHRNGEFSNSYCYHEQSNMLVVAAADYYHVRIFLIDLNTQQEKEVYSEITGTEIKEVVFSKYGERLFVAMERKLLAITVATGLVQVIESTEEYRIHSVRVLDDDSVEVCVYYPIEFEKCKVKNAYAYRTVYQYDAQENEYVAKVSGELPKLHEEKCAYWAFAHREAAFFKNKKAERGYLNLAVSWECSRESIEDNGKPIGFPDSEKYQIKNDFTIPTAVTYDTMLLMQSYDRSTYQLIEYGERGIFVKADNIILEFTYTEQGICKEPHVIHPVVVNGDIMEITFITWGFGENYYSILANGKVVEMNELGEIQKEFPICTGISVVGCDFRGSVMDSGLKEKLVFHGGRF